MLNETQAILKSDKSISELLGMSAAEKAKAAAKKKKKETEKKNVAAVKAGKTTDVKDTEAEKAKAQIKSLTTSLGQKMEKLYTGYIKNLQKVYGKDVSKYPAEIKTKIANLEKAYKQAQENKITNDIKRILEGKNVLDEIDPVKYSPNLGTDEDPIDSRAEDDAASKKVEGDDIHLYITSSSRSFTDEEVMKIQELSANGVMIDTESDFPMPWDADFVIEGEEVVFRGGVGPSGFGRAEARLPIDKVEGLVNIYIEPNDSQAEADILEIVQLAGYVVKE